jgi:hypothetical protein
VLQKLRVFSVYSFCRRNCSAVGGVRDVSATFNTDVSSLLVCVVDIMLIITRFVRAVPLRMIIIIIIIY